MLARTTHLRHYCSSTSLIPSITSSLPISRFCVVTFRRDSAKLQEIATAAELLRFRQSSSTSPRLRPMSAAGVPPPPLDLTEDNIKQVLADARVELAQLFDSSVGITGVVELAELDGPFVKISLRGRFWHERSTVLARLGNYLKQRIPEILEVDIEDEKMLDDSPENF